jgi:hypothetical protein
MHSISLATRLLNHASVWRRVPTPASLRSVRPLGSPRVPPWRSAGGAAVQAVRRAARRALRYRGMLVIVLWQAPVGPRPGPDGSIGIFFGSGFDEVVDFSCDSPARTRGISYRTAAVEADYNVTPELRIEAALEAYSSDEAMNSLAGAVQFRGDWRWLGAGAGVALVPAFDPVMDLTGPAPSVYLRLGAAEQLHARADLWPARALGTQQVFRLGVGWNATRRDRVSALAGTALIGSNGDGDGFFGEVSIPAGDRAALRVVGHTGSGLDNRISGLAVGARFLLH